MSTLAECNGRTVEGVHMAVLGYGCLVEHIILVGFELYFLSLIGLLLLSSGFCPFTQVTRSTWRSQANWFNPLNKFPMRQIENRGLRRSETIQRHQSIDSYALSIFGLEKLHILQTFAFHHSIKRVQEGFSIEIPETKGANTFSCEGTVRFIL